MPILDAERALAAPRHPALRIAHIPNRGRGVMAGAPIGAGDLLEVCPAIPMAKRDETTPETTIHDYCFFWDEPPAEEAVALGMMSLCNHSPTPNADFETDVPNGVIRFVALRDIEKGEEITIDYVIPLWFEYRE